MSEKPKYPRGVRCRGGKLYLRFSLHGRRFEEALGLVDNKQNQKFAANKLAQIEQAIATRTFEYTDHFPESKHANGLGSNPTMKEAVEQYLELKAVDVRSTTLVNYTSSLKQFIVIYGENRRVDSLSPMNLAKARVTMMKMHKSRTINTRVVLVNAFLKWLAEFGLTSEKFKINSVKNTEKEPDPFSMEEYQAIRQACRREQTKNLFDLMLHTGVRLGEVSVLAWEDVNWQERTLTVSRAMTENMQKLKTTKTDKSRVIHLFDEAYKALECQYEITKDGQAYDISVEFTDKSVKKESVHFIFLSQRQGFMSRGTIRDGFKQACLRSDVRYRSVYNLRHTYASRMLTAGGNPSYIAKQMGHANFLMLAKVYGKFMEDGDRNEHLLLVERLKI